MQQHCCSGMNSLLCHRVSTEHVYLNRLDNTLTPKVYFSGSYATIMAWLLYSIAKVKRQRPNLLQRERDVIIAICILKIDHGHTE